jgi:arylsulfatase A-like enzyme
MNWDATYAALDALDRGYGQNNFLFLHFMDVHGPPLFWSHWRDARSVFRNHSIEYLFRKEDPAEYDLIYLNQVAEFDRAMGLLLSYLSSPRWSDQVSVVLLADHGQPQLPSTEDPVAAKDPVLSERMIHVPLLVKCPWRPDLAGRRFDGLTEVGIDLYSSLLDLAGITAKRPVHSRSFIPSPGQSYMGKPFVITESIYEGRLQRIIRSTRELFYRSFSWRIPGEREERLWQIAADQRYRECMDQNMEKFRKIERDLNLVCEQDNPRDYYGSKP